MTIPLIWRLAGFVVILAGFGKCYSQAQTSLEQTPAIRLAIVCAPEVVAEGDQLMVFLSDRGFDLLERTDLSLIVKEGLLTRGTLPATLASADALVLVEVVSVNDMQLLATRIVGCGDGRIHSSDLRLRYEADQNWTHSVNDALRALRETMANTTAERLKVSVQAVREEYVAGKTENPAMGRAVTQMVVSGLSQQGEIQVLERYDLALVQFERLLTRIDDASFEGADHIVTATFQREKKTARISIQVGDKRGGGDREEFVSIDSDDLGEIAKAIVERALPLVLDGSEDSKQEVRIKPFRGLNEASRFAAEAERALRLGLHEHAASFAETAYLLNDDDSGESLYLLASADLLASMPGLRGKGLSVDQGFTMQTGPTGQPEVIDLLREMVDGREDEEFPLPDHKQWEVLALSVERSFDLLRRAHRRNEESISGTKALYLGRSLLPLVKEVVLNSFAKFRDKIPNYEREMIQRIAAAIRRPPEEADAEIDRMLFDYLVAPYELLLLDSSRDRSVETIRSWLYGPHLSEFRESAIGRDEGARRSRLETLRSTCFAVFEYQGFDPGNGDKRSNSIDDRISGVPFVAWLSGAGTTFEEAFEAAAAEVPEEYRELARIDSLWCKASIEKRGPKRNEAISSLRFAIRENFDYLRELGLFQYYIEKFLHLEAGRYSPSDGEDLGGFWREAYAAIYANNYWNYHHIISVLFKRFNGERWDTKPIENPEAYIKFLSSLEADLLKSDDPSAESRRKTWLDQIAKAKAAVAKPAPASNRDDYTAVGALKDIPESETLVVKGSVYGSDLPTLATFVGDDGIYQFQHGSFDSGVPSKVLHFFHGRCLDEITVPDEVKDLVAGSSDHDSLQRIQRIGAIDVSGDRISVAFPGGIATYHRGTKVWAVTPVPFLAGRGGMAFVGGRIVSHIGATPLRTGPMMETTVYTTITPGGGQRLTFGSPVPGQGPPVSGLYATSPDGLAHVAIIDNSRQPPRSSLDSARKIRFDFPPLAFTSERFLIGISADDSVGRAYEVDLALDVNESTKSPVALPFDPGTGAIVGGTRANGFVVVAASRKLVPTAPRPGLEGRLDLAAFAVGPDGKYHWLLDTGTPQYTNGQFVVAGAPSRSIFTNGEKPRYHFPEEFAVHRGMFSAPPVLHYDGTRLLMLTSQLTTDGRRLLYVWNDATNDAPKRMALRFEAFANEDGIDERTRLKWNSKARNEIFSMFTFGGFLHFEYRSGFYTLALEELGNAIEE